MNSCIGSKVMIIVSNHAKIRAYASKNMITIMTPIFIFHEK